MGSMRIGEVSSQLRAQNPDERLRERFVNPHKTAALSCRSGYLAPDETRSDDVDARAINDRGQQGIGVGQLPEIKPMLETRKPPRRRSASDAHDVPRDRPPRLELGCMPFDPEVGDPLTQSELDAQLAVLLGRPQPQTIARYRPKQVSLGKMRTLVGHLRLRAYEQDLARETPIPQARGDGVACRAAADDQRSGRLLSM
jgi:hypothetical protein